MVQFKCMDDRFRVYAVNPAIIPKRVISGLKPTVRSLGAPEMFKIGGNLITSTLLLTLCFVLAACGGPNQSTFSPSEPASPTLFQPPGSTITVPAMPTFPELPGSTTGPTSLQSFSPPVALTTETTISTPPTSKFVPSPPSTSIPSPEDAAFTTTRLPDVTTPPVPTTQAVDLANIALIGTEGGFNLIDKTGIRETYGGPSGVKDMIVDKNGIVWAAESSVLSTYDGQDWQVYPQPKGVYSTGAIALDSKNRIWIGHYKGVSVLEGGQWLTYGSDKFGLGQFSELVNDIAIDHDNRVWVATSAGVAVYDGNHWAHYDESSGLVNNTIEAVICDRKGKVWIAHTYGVETFDGSGWVFYGDEYKTTPKIKVEDLHGVKSLAVDGQGYIWAGTTSHGVSVFDGIQWKTYQSHEHFCGAAINGITFDSLNRVWLATDFGLFILDSNKWFHYTRNSSQIISNDINIVMVTGSGPASIPPAAALKPGAVQGTVLVNNQPVDGVLVVLCFNAVMLYSGEAPYTGESYSATADRNGGFHIVNVPPGVYDMCFKTPGGKWYLLLGNVRVIDDETTFLKKVSI
jgi:hypothetical protein